MDGAEDDMDSEVEEYSGMEQPPLIKQLKGILAEYPDDGQIIKELIQNAEDAGATEMKILYDGRTINKDVAKTVPYRKFFMGPALCFYNNEVFTENDWHGIRMIYSSVKEEDPLKVGRFGLGFKSVFHITDYPCIISGQRILLMNPHEKVPDKVCITIKLANLKKCKRMKIPEFLEAFEGTFGFSVDSLNTGNFNGTIFWFPLRETSSDLSDTAYDKSKILDLFRSFQTEAVNSLLFLKSLCRVTLQCRGSATTYDLPSGQPFFVVELEDHDSAIKEERRRFLDKIKDTCRKAPPGDFISVTKPKFKTRLLSEETLEEGLNESSWLVVNMFKGGKMSDKLKSLANDKDLFYIPFVGVAVPLSTFSSHFKGHIFCFLPLPQERRSLTGLPVHVNGFFAMSQNRRHLKWASADQETFHMHRDKAIEWNECLINEVLPGAYIRLINEVIVISQNSGNSVDAVETVYTCIPDISEVDTKWEQCVKHLYKELFQTSLVFVRKHARWTKPNQPMYTTFDQQNVSRNIQDSVITVLNRYPNIQITSVPKHVWRFLKMMTAPKDISPLELARLLKEGDTYLRCVSQDDKLNILDYIVKDKEFGLLQDLELLPMEDGSFIKFRQKGSRTSPVYVCNKEETLLFPGLEQKLVSMQGPKKLRSTLIHLAKVGKYQIEQMTVHGVATLLTETIQNHFGDKDPVELNVNLQDNTLSDWIEHVWNYILRYHPNKISLFSSLSLLPSIQTGSWTDRSWKTGKLLLYKLTNVFVVKSDEEMEDVADGVYVALTHLSVKVLASLPPWIDSGKIPCVYHLTRAGLSRLLERLQGLGTAGIVCFNNNCRELDREAFVNMLAGCSPSLLHNSVAYLQKLNLFQQKASVKDTSPIYLAIAADSRIAHVGPDFPVRFPEPIFVASSKRSLLLANVLGATEMNVTALVACVLEAIQSGEYSEDEVDTFMKWFLLHIAEYTTQKEIIAMARDVAFVQSESGLFKPSDLYDSRDKFLRALFFGEDNKFPIGEYTSDSYLNALQSLGLNTRKNVLADSLYTTARIIDHSCQTGEINANILQKATALFVSFEAESNTLSSYLDSGAQLYSSISHFKCILHKKDRPKNYPKELPWEGSKFVLCSPDELKGIAFSNTAGSVHPLVKYKSKTFGELFQWDSPPGVTVLTAHLKVIQANYTSTNKPKFLPLISDTFKAMADNASDVKSAVGFQTLSQGHCIWWGDGFCSPKAIMVERNSSDVDLKPYMYTLPAEFKDIQSFFRVIGCQQRQCSSVLLDVLSIIAKKHSNNPEGKKRMVRKDLNLVLQILVKLFQDKQEINNAGERILFPIHTDDDRRLILKPCSKCTYCDAQWLRDVTTDDCEEEDIYYVHGEVPAYISEGLGVRSLRQHLMSDAEGLEEWGQEEPLTRRLHNLLKEGYTDGLSVPKELIQNADDAGATECFFIYDERQNLDARTQLLDENMADCQGPALWAYNNAIFSEDDLKNITKLSGATKETDTTKIGKFGLGFCAVYNLTDVPSFVSGKNLVIFDPHTTFLGKALPGKSPGLRIDLQKMKNLRMMKRLNNQFKPFQDVLDCDLSVSQKEHFFRGTLFRFPLRTQKQAGASLIKNLCYSKEEVLKLLKQFAEASGNMLLFTQKLEKIKVYHIPESGVLPSKAEVLFVVSKETANQTSGTSVLELCSNMKRNKTLTTQSYETLQRVNISVECLKKIDMLHDLQTKSSKTTWLVSWATGTCKSLQLCSSAAIKGALPLGGVAILTATESKWLTPKSLGSVPFGFYTTGHIFCYLPLPEKTHLQVHVNGSFAVTSERRGLRTYTEDDKYAYDADWNETLLEDAVVNAFIHLLVCLHEKKTLELQPLSPEYKFYTFWPLSTQTGSNMSSFNRGFYNSLIAKDIPVFNCNGIWTGLKNCVFLEKSLRYEPKIGSMALSTLQQFNRNEKVFIVDLPVTYFDELQKTSRSNNRCRIITKEDFFKDYFLKNISDDYWTSKETDQIRNKLLLYCLEQSTKGLDAAMKLTDCIPTKPNAILRKPRDLVYPDGELSHLFSTVDNRFPEKSFSSNSVLSRLVSLGMMKDRLLPSLVVDRASTIPDLASEGNYSKALDRCRHLLGYLAGCDEVEEDEMGQMQDIPFLPVLAKPTSWPFSWKYDRLMTDNVASQTGFYFVKPSCLYISDCNAFVACVQLILDSDSLRIKAKDQQIFFRLGVKNANDITFEIAVQQLLSICCETETSTETRIGCTHGHIVDKIYKFLNDIILDHPDMVDDLKSLLSNKPVIYLGKEFLSAEKVAFSIGYDCSPELYEIGQHSIKKYQEFLKAAGVRTCFEIGDVVEILKKKKLLYQEASIPIEEHRLVCRLLQCLADLMVHSNKVYGDLTESWIDYIVAPDMCFILRPTHMLCFDDCDFVKTSDSMQFIHADISRTVAENLGVFTKRNKHIESCSIEIAFEQKEELLTRLKGLLDGYPCDIGIMKELIQNADDAHASEIHFVKDYTTHGCKTIFIDSFAEFQGPALCVYNDSVFTQQDLDGIQKLGVGSKGDDPAKTGQYGVGFNAVYNLTDLPSFLTKGPNIEGGETLCFFDPLHKHVKQRVGTRYIDMKAIRTTYPDVMTGYNEEIFFSKQVCRGTVFRFPLRQSKSEISDTIIKEDKLENMFASFKLELLEMLLFLKSLTKITVSTINAEGLKTEWSVSMTLTENDANQRSSFSVKCKDFAQELKNKNYSILTRKSYKVGYKLQTKDKLGIKESWFVEQRIGLDGQIIPQTVEKAINNGTLGLLPIGGVAVREPRKSHELASRNVGLEYQSRLPSQSHVVGNFRAFCFLPLPGNTGLPMHINAHFVLDHEARRGLWKEDQGFKSDWNNLLLANVVAPAYVDALKFVKSTLFCKEESVQQSRAIVVDRVLSFSSFFPVAKQTHDEYWKHLVKGVFESMSNNDERLFPVIIQQKDDKQNDMYEISWNALYQKGHKFPVYFARNNTGLILSDSLIDLLTNIGMKITTVSFEVQQSLIDSDVPVTVIDPYEVIQYLKSHFCTQADNVKDSQIPCPVTESKLRSVANVNEVLSFCGKSDSFETNINKLPLLVTNDGLLRYFDINLKVFCTKYFTLLPNAGSKFVHAKQIHTLSLLGNAKVTPVIAELHIKDFADLLRSNLDDYQFTRQDIVDLDSVELPFEKNSWVSDLWKYIEEDYEDQTKSGSSQTFEEFLEPLQQWSFVPATKGEASQILVKISKLYSVISIETFASISPLEEAMKKLELPCLNKALLTEHAVLKMSSSLANAENPVSVLICLKYYREEIATRQLCLADDCCSILGYFSDNLSAMQEKNEVEKSWIADSLRCLPLYITKEGHKVSFESQEGSVLVLPDEIPQDGLEQWAETTGTVLLQNNPRLTQLYEFLGFTYTEKIDVYLEHILKKWFALPDLAIFKHLEYIKDNLLLGSFAYFNVKQRSMVQALQKTPLIVENGVRKNGSNYYSPHHSVFKIMCQTEHFPPENLSANDWERFLELIGVKCQVTGQLFVQFAKDVAAEGRNGISQPSAKKSRVLIDHLLSSSTAFERDVYMEISHIKFVVPHTIDTKYINVHQQHSKAGNFISYDNSVSYRFFQLVWSSMALFPDWADPMYYKQKKKEELLNIHHEPPLDSIIKHCQNICDSMKRIYEDDNNKRMTVYDWVEPFMEVLYNSLHSKGMSSDKAKERLYHTPVVFIPETKLFVPAHQVIEDMSSDQEISPYLLKAPVRYGKFFPLFIYLGAEKSPAYITYIKVLAKIKEDVQCDQLGEQYLTEWGAIRMAIENLFHCLKPVLSDSSSKVKREIPSGTVLYLPTRDKYLLNSSEMTVVDSRYFMQRLREANNLQIFIGLKVLKSSYNDSSIRWLPKPIQPKFLSDIVSEEVDTTEMVEVPNSPAAIRLDTFIQSDHFITGLLRVLKHFKTEEEIKSSGKGEEDVLLRIQNTKVRQVTGLKTYLLLSGERNDASAELKECFIPKPIEDAPQMQLRVYLQTKSKSEIQLLQSIDTYLIEYINYVTGYQIPGHYIIKLFQKITDPTGIDIMLDRLKIRPYELQESVSLSVFPEPGTYVPVELHHLLNCEFSEFKPYEYRSVALELEDAEMQDEVQESYTPVYIYVRIEKIMPSSEGKSSYLSQRYEVFTGSEMVIVPVFKIYKFIRPRSEGASMDLVATGVIPETRQEQSLNEVLYSVRHTLQEAWQLSEEDRKHIIKRLYLRWHPDKNIGNEDFCAKVFRYIKEVISKLENGIPLDDGDSDASRQSRAYPDFTSSQYFRFCERMDSRSQSHRAYAQHYYDDGGGSFSQGGFGRRTSGFKTSFVHKESRTQEYKDIGEAHRWQWQAKVDLRHASDTIEHAHGDPPAYNCICFWCHQAVEKSLKAAGFARDANSVDKNTFDIVSLASRLTEGLKRLTSELSNLVGEHTKMRYPNVLQRPQIPSTVYTRDQAVKACELARQILELVAEEYSV